MTACPACGAALARGQEYCVECGLRLPGPGRVGPPPRPRRSLLLPVAATLLLAAGSAGAAVAVTWEGEDDVRVLTATGGSLVVTRAEPDGLARWPAGRDGWTIVLASIPKAEGRDAAVDVAREARSRGLPEVGVLDSARIGGVHPGYWIVFQGTYDSQPQATSQLQRARAAVRTASTRRIVG